jgi:hypothetical protein
MGQTEGVGVVLNGDIVGDDEFFESGSDRITKREIGFKQEGFGGGGDSSVGFESSLGRDDCGANAVSGLKLL